MSPSTRADTFPAQCMLGDTVNKRAVCIFNFRGKRCTYDDNKTSMKISLFPFTFRRWYYFSKKGLNNRQQKIKNKSKIETWNTIQLIEFRFIISCLHILHSKRSNKSFLWSRYLKRAIKFNSFLRQFQFQEKFSFFWYMLFKACETFKCI